MKWGKLTVLLGCLVLAGSGSSVTTLSNKEAERLLFESIEKGSLV